MLFITHNLGVVACIGDSVLVMDKGVLCEAGGVREVLSTPVRRLHPAAARARRRACPDAGSRVGAVATAIVGGTVVGPDGSARADVLVEDGVIVRGRRASTRRAPT